MAPVKTPAPDDPNLLVGSEVPGGLDAVREMASAFAEEFARLGHDADRILGLFRNPFHAWPPPAWPPRRHRATPPPAASGPAPWLRVRLVTRDRAPAPGGPPPGALPAGRPRRPTVPPRREED